MTLNQGPSQKQKVTAAVSLLTGVSVRSTGKTEDNAISFPVCFPYIRLSSLKAQSIHFSFSAQFIGCCSTTAKRLSEMVNLVIKYLNDL